MSFGVHLFLAIVWFLLTLAVLGFGIYGLVKGVAVLSVSCFAIVGISSLLIVNDYKNLFGSHVSSTKK